MKLSLNRHSVVGLFLVIMMGGALSSCKSPEASIISGSALYREKIALPPHAIFEVTLEDVSRADAPAIILGKVEKTSFGQVPISFSISYDPANIVPGHSYSLRAKIIIDGNLRFITDTAYPVLTGEDDSNLQLIMKRFRREQRVLKNESPSTGPFADFPLHFLGILPGVNCESQYQLDLFSNNAFFLRIVCLKDGEPSKPSDDIGRWSYDDSNKQLILSGGRESKVVFAVLDSKTIEKRTSEGAKINSKLNYKLEDSQTVKTIDPRVFMHGMYQYMADSAVFRECLTGFKLPVAFEGDNAALERAYLGSHIEPGSPLMVHLDGSIVQRPVTDGPGTESHLLVDHFIKAIPLENCGNPFSTASITNTYWRLTALNGATIGRKTPMLREAHLVFHIERKGVTRLAGSTGCNSLSGTYKLVGQEINLDQPPLAMTMMACPKGNIEKEFLAMLKEVKGWKISGEHLVLFGEDVTQALGRFEATYLR